MSVLQGSSTVNAELTAHDVQTSPGPTPEVTYTEDADLRIVLDDYHTAEAWLANEQWALQWRESRVLYQSPRGLSTFEGSGVTRSNVSRFTVAKQVNSLAPAIHGAIFADATPFEVQPRPRTSQNAAYAWKHLLSTLLDECDFKSEITTGVEGMVNQGTVIFKGGWAATTKIEKHWVRKQAPPTVDLPLQSKPMTIHTKESDEFHVEEPEVTHNRPWIEKCELGTVYIDPKWNKPNQLWKARYLIHKDYVTYEDLKILAQDNDQYDIPDEETLRRMIFGDEEQTVGIDGVEQGLTTDNGNALAHAAARHEKTSADPALKSFELLEWWSEDECKVVLQQKVVIRRGRHGLGTKPFWSANFWNMEDTGYGMGVGRIAGSDQRVDQGTINAALDIISFAVNPEYIVSRSANAPTQDMRRRLGGVRPVDGDPRMAYHLMEQPKVPADVWTVTQMSREASESATGADQATVQGAMPGGKSSFGRSGTGAGLLGKASAARIQAPLDRVVDGVILPFLDFCFEQVRERMPTSEIRKILSDAETQDLEVDMGDFLNARLKFDTLAGTRLAARQAMASALPFLLQVFENPALINQLNQTGYKIDAMQLVGMVMDVSEWKNARQIIVPMTPEEQQAKAQQNPDAAKLQTQQTLLAQKHQNDTELEDQKIHGRIAAAAIEHATSKLAETPLDRAANFATRDQLEQNMKESQYFSGAGGGL